MSPEKPTPQHDDEATLVEIIRRSLADCTLTEPDAWGIAAEKLAADIALAGFEISQHDPLDAALDLVGRRTDIVAVQLPEPTAPDFTGVEWSDKAAGWDVFAYGSTEHRGKVQVRIPEFVAPADARNAAAALYAAAALADAADGEAK